ncbi:unnamed protein product [Arctogadus glacialis]
MARLLLSNLLLLASTLSVACTGSFELKIESFSTVHTACSSDVKECQVFFRACLKHELTVIGPEPPCTYGMGLTDVLRVDPSSVSASTLIRVPFRFKWPGSFSLILEAWSSERADVASTENQLLSRLATRISLAVGESWSGDSYEDDLSSLRFSFRAVCDPFYHGEDCGAYCRPRNDSFGHNACDAAGNKTCLEGWNGVYCDKPICGPGCSEQHGECEAPGRCRCHQGWTGPRCDQCVLFPECLHGTCQEPWKCDCKEGWGGLLCDQDLNYCTNHKPCRNGASCSNTGRGSYTCACRPGYSGEDCALELNECDSAPCRNGGSCNDLEGGFSCSCPPGFYGNACEVSAPACGDTQCFNGGSCQARPGGGVGCVCPAGFTGSNCERRLGRCDSSPCANGGQCAVHGQRVTCRCRPGFSGPLCAVNVDECAAAPCRNGGSCSDGVGRFRCACALGFTGADCSVRSEACDRLPCRNGGACFTHLSGPVCRCPAGFMGDRCQYAQPATPPATPPAPSPAPGGGGGGLSAVLLVSVALALLTLGLLTAVVVFLARQLRRGGKLALRRGGKLALAAVKNDLDALNNQAPPPREREAFLLPGGPGKVSNQDAALEHMALFKNKMADFSLAREQEASYKNKFDINQRDACISVPSETGKEGLYQAVFSLPEPHALCVLATEV